MAISEHSRSVQCTTTRILCNQTLKKTSVQTDSVDCHAIVMRMHDNRMPCMLVSRSRALTAALFESAAPATISGSDLERSSGVAFLETGPRASRGLARAGAGGRGGRGGVVPM